MGDYCTATWMTATTYEAMEKRAALPVMAVLTRPERVTCAYCGVHHEWGRAKCSECGAPLPQK